MEKKAIQDPRPLLCAGFLSIARPGRRDDHPRHHCRYRSCAGLGVGV
jgi:hypothetical protein